MSIVGDIAKKFEKLKEQIQCVINVIGKRTAGTDLEKKYVEFKAAVKAVLTQDIRTCAQTNGVRAKIRYVTFFFVIH